MSDRDTRPAPPPLLEPLTDETTDLGGHAPLPDFVGEPAPSPAPGCAPGAFERAILSKLDELIIDNRADRRQNQLNNTATQARFGQMEHQVDDDRDHCERRHNERDKEINVMRCEIERLDGELKIVKEKFGRLKNAERSEGRTSQFCRDNPAPENAGRGDATGGPARA